MTTADLIIIGAGPGGYRTAEYAAKQGLKVVIFEGDNVGGTCLNVGCIPTKTYVHSSTFAEARERMAKVVYQLRAGVEGILSHPDITLVREKGVFVDANTVGDYTARNIIIATGSETKLLPLPDIDDPRLVDSTGLLALETLPRRLCIIGAGVIGMEFASIFNALGSEVSVVEFLKECLPPFDSDIAKRLRQQISKRGVEFYMQAGVKAISGNTVTFERKGKEQTVEADLILIATGRQPNVEGLGLERAGIDFSKRGIQVDDNFQTNVPGIYAIGDVNAKCMLAHAAEFQGFHVVNHIIGKPGNIRHEVMPSAIFTHPEAASVGMTEDQCKEQGIAAVCKKAFFRANGKALAMNETEGLLKLIAREDGRILGCHAYGAHAADLVQEVSVLICRDTTIDELKDMVHIHPTLSEIVHDAAMNF